MMAATRSDPITDEMERFIVENHKGVSAARMAALLKERFGTNHSKKQILRCYWRHGLNSGLTGRFEKGQEPANKGKRRQDYMTPEGIERSRRAGFQKGNALNPALPIGTVRVRTQNLRGYKLMIEKVAQPNRWEQHHRLVWERANGPVPDGMVVCFADGDTMNCDLENLYLETKAQHAVKNRKGIRGYDRESQIAANAIADLMTAIKRAKKRNGRHEKA